MANIRESLINVVIDDKLRILAMMKAIWGDRLTTVFPRQGHYATDASILAANPAADLAVEQIGDLRECDLSTFAAATTERELQEE